MGDAVVQGSNHDVTHRGGRSVGRCSHAGREVGWEDEGGGFPIPCSRETHIFTGQIPKQVIGKPCYR